MRRAITSLCLALCLGQGSFPVWADTPTQSPPRAPAGGLSPEARDRFITALAALKAGDGNTAVSELGERDWTSTPLADYAALIQAESLLLTGNQEGARAAALRAANATPESYLAPSALLRAATVLSSAGDQGNAIVLWRRYLARHGDNSSVARARLALAQALLADGRTQEAAKAFTDLYIQFPASREAEDAGRQLRALADAGTAVPPLGTREKLERAERLLTAGRGETAQTEADALLADGGLPPDQRARALKIVFDASRRAGRYEDAKATVTRALSALPPDARRFWLLDLARLQKPRSREQALATLDKLARDYPKTPEAADALLAKGRLLEEMSKFSEAQVAYRKLVANHPDETDTATALWRLGWLDWFRGSYADAASAWSRILTARGGPPYRDAVSYWIARADEMRGEATSAAKRLGRIQSEAPRSYYGVLAGQRSGRATAPSSAPVSLPADPLEALQGDQSYARVEALRMVGLTQFADEEMAEMTRRVAGDQKLLYALSAAYVQDARYHLALRILRRHFSSTARNGDPATPRVFWEMFYPIGWRTELTDAAGRASIDPLLVAAVVREESSYYPRARSRVGARGLMQLMPDTARPMAQARRLPVDSGEFLDDPAVNLELGSAYLAGLLREFGDPRVAVAAYNAGPTRVREWWGGRRSADLDVWVEQIPYDETRAFVKRVMLGWDEYRRLYGGSPAAPSDDSQKSAPREEKSQ